MSRNTREDVGPCGPCMSRPPRGARSPVALAAAITVVMGALLAACGSNHAVGNNMVTPPAEAGVTPIDGSTLTSDGGADGDGGACTTTIQEWPEEGFTH